MNLRWHSHRTSNESLSPEAIPRVMGTTAPFLAIIPLPPETTDFPDRRTLKSPPAPNDPVDDVRSRNEVLLRLKRFALCVVTLAISLAGFAGCESSSPSAPKADSGIVFPEPTIAGPILFSEVAAGTVDDATMRPLLRVSNSSDAARSIKFDGTGCSCYSLKLGDQVLRPEDSIELAAGESKEFRFSYNDPPRPKESDFLARFSSSAGSEYHTHELRQTLQILADIDLTPEVLTSTFTPGLTPAPLSLNVTLRSRDRAVVDESPQLITPPEWIQPGIWSAIQEATEEDGVWRRSWTLEVSFVLDPSQPVQTRHWTGSVQNESRLSVPVSISLRQRVGVSAPTLVPLGPVTQGVEKVRRVLLRSVDDHPFQVIGIVSDDPQVSAMADQQTPALQQWITIRCSGEAPGNLNARIACQLSHSVTPEVSFQVTGTITE
ncbi:MAG: hypothetical protein R3C01_08675 [Planctomycetaceae bacterium]